MKRKVLYVLLSVVVAFGLWLYVITVVSPESKDTFHGIRVELINEDALHEKRLMVITDHIPTVTLELLGNRSDLSKVNPSNITVVADLSKISHAGEQDLYYTVNVPGNSISIENQSPSSIKVTVVERASKEVPVVVTYNGKVPEGFLTDRENQTLDHETVTVTGPASVIDKIAQANITVDLEGQRETIHQSYQYTLCDAKGNAVDAGNVVTDVMEINLTLKIQRVKEIQLGLTVTPGGGATEQTAQITLSHTSIQVSGSEQILEQLEDTLIIGQLDLAELTGDTEKVFTFKLPEGVTNLSMPNNEVVVTVKFPNLKTKTLRITDIRPRNVPAGLMAEIMTKELTVTIRGPGDQINALTETDVVVIVDFADAEAGTAATFPAQIYVMNVEDCGAVGVHSVYAKVTEKTETP